MVLEVVKVTDGSKSVNYQDLEKATDLVIVLQKQKIPLPNDQNTVLAVHKSAIEELILRNENRPLKISNLTKERYVPELSHVTHGTID